MVELWDVLLVRLVDDVAPLLRGLTSEQRSELFDNLAEDNEELWEEYAGSTSQMRRQRRSKATIRILQRFMGRLTDEQKSTVHAGLDGMHDVAEEWLARRQNWQANFRALLEGTAAGAEFTTALRDLVLRPDQFDTVAYRRKVADNRERVFVMLAELTGQMTTTQRDRMGRKLREYASDLDELARFD
jgi:hypothetical protein